MANDFLNDLVSLLGKEINAPEVKLLFETLDSRETVKLNELKEPRWASEAAGMEVHASKKIARIVTLFLYADGVEGNSQYKGALPCGLTFQMSRQQATDCFSNPPRRSSDKHAAWVFDDHKVIVQFKPDGAIKVVGLTSDL